MFPDLGCFFGREEHCVSFEEGKSRHTSIIWTPKGQNQLSALQRCPYYRGKEFNWHIEKDK